MVTQRFSRAHVSIRIGSRILSMRPRYGQESPVFTLGWVPRRGLGYEPECNTAARNQDQERKEAAVKEGTVRTIVKASLQ